jgi:hypothetical protein
LFADDCSIEDRIFDKFNNRPRTKIKNSRLPNSPARIFPKIFCLLFSCLFYVVASRRNSPQLLKIDNAILSKVCQAPNIFLLQFIFGISGRNNLSARPALIF